MATISAVGSGNEGIYQCRASNSEGTAHSDVALLQLASEW